MNIYLDIDGVLLASSDHAAHFADDFLQFVLKHWPDNTYWLTTHCWRGENRTRDILKPVLKSETARLLTRIKPTEWDSEKTDAIDFSTPFLWYDDDLYPEERKALELFNALDCLRRINLQADPYQLVDEVKFLRQFI